MCGESRYSEAIDELKKAKYHATKMTQYSKQKSYCFTSPLFDHLKGEKPPTDSKTTDLDDFYKSLENNTCFDAIRNSESFQALYDK